MWLGPLPLLCDRRDHRVGDVMTGVRIRCEAWSLTGGMRVNVERYQRHALTPHAKAVPRYRLTRRPCGGGCACGRGARAQNQQQNRSQPEKSQPNQQRHHYRNPNAASARRGHGHECRGRSGRPCRHSACDLRPGSRDATRANATRPRKKPKHHARSAHGRHATPNANRHASRPNASRPGLVPRSGGTSHPDPRGPRRPGPRACAWRAAGDRSCPPECPGR